MPRVCAGKHLNKMYKAIIFDLDGTLLNTSRDICKTLNASLAKFGCPAVTVEQTLSYVGDGAKKLIERAAPHNFKEFDELYADYLKRFAACDNSLTSLYPHEAEFLSAAKGRGIKLAILTNKPADATAKVYNMYLAAFSFDIVVGNDARFALKPDPSAALQKRRQPRAWGMSPHCGDSVRAVSLPRRVPRVLQTTIRNSII